MITALATSTTLLRRVARANGMRRDRQAEYVHRGRWSGKRFKRAQTYRHVLAEAFRLNVCATHGKTRSAKRRAKAQALWAARQETAS